MNDKKTIYIYTDGACRGNPGPGGWGALLRYNGHEKELYGYEPHTTNNRMELTAAIKAIEAINRDSNIVLVTDSVYVRDGITKWIHSWKTKNWRGANKKPIKNVDLWQELDELITNHSIDWQWVKGHSGHPENERADELANIAIDEMMS